MSYIPYFALDTIILITNSYTTLHSTLILSYSTSSQSHCWVSHYCAEKRQTDLLNSVWLITASDYIGPHPITSDQIWLNCAKIRLQWPRTACIPVVNHALAHSRKCLSYMMLEENPLFHAAAVRSAERVPSGLQSPAYWKLYCFTDCWRHVHNRWPRPNTAFLAA